MIEQIEINVERELANKTDNLRSRISIVKEDFSTKQVMVTVRLFDTREWV